MSGHGSPAFEILDFAKAEAVLEQARPAVEELRVKLVEMGLTAS